MSYTNISLPAHPGTLLRTTLDHLNCTRTTAARLLGLSRQTVYEITSEKQAITPSVALRVGKMTGTRPEKWLDMQQAYDLAVARVAYSKLLQTVPQLEECW